MPTPNRDVEQWDQAAELYARMVGGPDDSFYRRFSPFLWQQLGDVTGKRILDLGSGHGWLTEELHRAGAQASGVDGSRELSERARRDYPDVTFDVHDLRTGLPAPLRRYDAIVSHMVLMDIPDLGTLVEDLHTALAPDGVLIASILHPAFFHSPPDTDGAGALYRKVTGYLEHETWQIDTYGGHNHYHRPLAWYVELLAAHGFAITAMDEPPTLPYHRRSPSEWTEYERWFSSIPTMLSVACRPTSAR